MVAFIIASLWLTQPEVKFTLLIPQFKINIVLPHKLKIIILVILNSLTIVLVISTFLALVSMFNWINPESSIGQLTKRLAVEFITVENWKLIIGYVAKRVGIISMLIAAIPLAFTGTIFMITNMIFLTISAFPIPILLLCVVMGKYYISDFLEQIKSPANNNLD